MYFGYERTLDYCREVATIAFAHPAVQSGDIELFVLPTLPGTARSGPHPRDRRGSRRRPGHLLGGRRRLHRRGRRQDRGRARRQVRGGRPRRTPPDLRRGRQGHRAQDRRRLPQRPHPCPVRRRTAAGLRGGSRHPLHRRDRCRAEPRTVARARRPDHRGLRAAVGHRRTRTRHPAVHQRRHRRPGRAPARPARPGGQPGHLRRQRRPGPDQPAGLRRRRAVPGPLRARPEGAQDHPGRGRRTARPAGPRCRNGVGQDGHEFNASD